RAQAGVEIALAESFPERGESRLAGAVSRRDVADLVRVAQVRSDLVDLVVLGDDQMQTAGDETDARVDLRGGLDDLVDAGVRAAHHDDQSVGRVDGERQLAQLQRPRLVGDKRDEVDSGRDLGGPVDELEVRAWPGRA